MARNVSGTYSLPLANVTPGTVVLASWANTTLNDVAPELTDSLSRSGKGGMSAALGIVAGTAAAPGLGFVLEPSTGLYRSVVGILGIATSGVQRGLISTRWSLYSGEAAGSANADFSFITDNTRTAGLMFRVRNVSVDRFTVAWNGITAVSGAAAGDATTDVVLNSTATRTAGLLLDVQNNTVSRFRVSPVTATFTSGAAAGDATTDVVLNSTATRTAGLLLDVQNNTVSRFKVSPVTATFTSGAAAGDATTDAVLNSTATRTAGLLLDVQNNTVSRFHIDPDGLLVHGLGLVSTAGTAPIRIPISADVTCSSNAVATDIGPAITAKSGKTYRIIGHFRTWAEAATTGLRVGIKLTGAPTTSVVAIDHRHWDNVTPLGSYVNDAFADVPTPMATGTSYTVPNSSWDQFFASFTTTGTGTIQLILISEVNNSAVTVGAGGWFEISED